MNALDYFLMLPASIWAYTGKTDGINDDDCPFPLINGYTVRFTSDSQNWDEIDPWTPWTLFEIRDRDGEVVESVRWERENRTNPTSPVVHERLKFVSDLIIEAAKK